MANLRANNISGSGGRNALDGSVFFNGDDYLSLAANTDFAMGTGAFTAECWIYTTDYSHSEGGYSQRVFDSNGGQLGWYITSDGTGLTGSLVSGTDERSTYTPGLNVWTHIALARSGTTLKAFVNGVEVDSTTNSGSVASSAAFIIGARSSTEGAFKGDISNLRVIKGSALYTAAFTPPTEKLTAVAGTVLLCCQDSDDPTQEATGKTITGYGKLAAGQPIQHKKVPSVGIDEGVTFSGDAKINSLGYMYFPTGDTSQRGRGRGVVGSGETPCNDKVMDYVEIQSMGNAIKFGDLSAVSIAFAAVSSSTRGVFAIGVSPNITMEYITIATTSNSTDFGDQSEGHIQEASCSDNTRGLFAGGLFAPNTVYNTIEYITIATTGNDTDFGDLTRAATGGAGLSDTTRGVWAGGITGSPLAVSNIMDYVTIASTGNAADFGDLTVAARDPGGLASSTRGLIGSGTTPSVTNFIDYVTIQTTGNATDYGDLTSANANAGCTSNGTRGLWALGVNPAVNNSIDYTTIATTGNASDFGDLTRTVYQEDACSDSHGGLS